MLRQLLAAARALFHRRQEDAELSEELRAYIEAAAEEKIAHGMSRDDAFRAARTELGSAEAVKDEVRDVGWESRFLSLAQDLRYAVRMFRKNPGFSTVAILSLALGIGANTALFSLYDAVFLKQLAVDKPGELVALDWISSQKTMYRSLDGRSSTD